MKLPDFTDDPGLIELRTLMRASESGGFSPTYKPYQLTHDELEQLANGGIEVDFDEITPLEDGTLGYKNARVLVYIRDVNSYGANFNLPRFHVAHCRTLDEMRQAHRFERYVVATREDGDFWIQKITSGRRNEGSWERLDVCQNCLHKLNFDGFSLSLGRSQRLPLVKNFSIPRFFLQYPKSLHLRKPQHDYITSPLNDYTSDFSEVSKRTKTARDFQCEECGLRPEARFLHVHHINGQKSDNSDKNLRVLCFGCHANMPLHGHMKATPGFSEFQRTYESD